MISFIKKIPDFILHILIILILSLITGYLVNRFSDNGIPYDEKISEKELKDKYSFISMEDAKNEFDHHSSLFVDSREKEYYDKGHIKGSVNIPAYHTNDKAVEFIRTNPDKNASIIIYCDGEECDLSPMVYNFLKDLGYTDLKILVNGWSLWQENHYPVEKNLEDQKSEEDNHDHIVHD